MLFFLSHVLFVLINKVPETFRKFEWTDVFSIASACDGKIQAVAFPIYLVVTGDQRIQRALGFAAGISHAVEQEIFPRVRMPQGVPFAISSFVRYGILVIGFLFAMGMLGFSLDRLTLLLGALGVGIGFGM